MIRPFPLLLAVCCLMQAAAASEPAQTPAQNPKPAHRVQSPSSVAQPGQPGQQPMQTGQQSTQSGQQEPKPAVPPLVLPTPAQGPIPPRDPRLIPPRVQDTTVPPTITVPPPPAGTIPPAIPIRPITADEAARIALRFQPNITIARADVTVQRGITRQVRSALLPQLTVTGSYTYVQNLTHPSTGGGSVGSGTGTGTGTGTTTGGTTGTGTTTGTGGTTGTGTGGNGTGTGGTTGSGTTTGTGGSTGTGTGTTTGTGGTGGTTTGSGGTTTGTTTGGTTTGTTGTGTGTSTGTGTTTGGTTGTGTTTGTGGTTGTGTGGATAGTGTGTPVVTTPSSGASGIFQGIVAEATLRQLIFDFNHTLDLVRQSVELERAAAQNLTRSQYDTILDVKQAFYLLVQNLQQVQVDELEVDNRQSQLNLAQARFNVGLGLPSDIITAQTAKAEAILLLNQARANAEQARFNLAIFMGIDPRTPLVPAQSVEPTIASNDINALTQTALAQRPEVLQAQFSLRSARYGVSAARTTNAPAIVGSASVISRGDQFLPQENDLTVGVGITWTPLDGGLTRGRVEQARGNVTIAEQQFYIAQQTVRSDVVNAYVNLRSAEQRVALAVADVNNATEGVRIATGRYSTGLGLFLDIINAQAFLLTARTNLVNTQNAVEQYRAALNHALGAPLPVR